MKTKQKGKIDFKECHTNVLGEKFYFCRVLDESGQDLWHPNERPTMLNELDLDYFTKKMGLFFELIEKFE